ncbi:hypothetical protein niasHS_004007 [Heterodera schachtii]|uniref:Thiamin pyrophosphokinase thiamin-binding domain-containing protein n=1 Tax=Heterodera schachtii TaxID=97005 RepID=A0ABD2K3U6_HETSC
MNPPTFAPFRLLRQHFDRLAVILLNSPPAAVVPCGDFAFPADWAKIWNSANIRLCTDGAANRLMKLCSDGTDQLKVPELIIGDFDSVSTEARHHFGGFGNCEQRKVPDQNSTDMTKALEALGEKHPNLSGILLLGGFHGRFDHVLGALHALLLHVQQWPQVPLFAVDNENVLTVLPEGEMLVELDAERITGTCGLFPIEQKTLRLTTDGFQWNLANQCVAFGQLVSSSNRILCPQKSRIKSDGGAVVFTFELREPNKML